MNSVVVMGKTGDVILSCEEQTGAGEDVESRHIMLHLQFADDTSVEQNLTHSKVSSLVEVVINHNFSNKYISVMRRDLTFLVISNFFCLDDDSLFSVLLKTL